MCLIPEGLSLLPFQKEAIDKMIHFLENSYTNSVYNASEMGLGKSIMAIACLNHYKPWKTLIICPSVMKYSWRDELNKWRVHRGYLPHIINTKKDLEKIAEQEYIIISYNLVPKVLMELKKYKWDFLILDEAHYCKSSKAQRTKAILGTRKEKGLWQSATYKIALSGTPFTRAVVDGYTLFSKMHPQAFPNFIDFTERYSEITQTPWGPKYHGVKNAKVLSKIIRENFYIRYTKEEVLKDLPEKTWQQITLPEKYAFSFTNKEDIEQVIKSLNVGDSIGISASLASERKQQGIKKLPPILEFIDEKLEEEIPLVVFAYHKDVIKKIVEHTKAYNPVVITGETPAHERHEAVVKFQTGDTNLIVLNIVAGGVGITLTRASTVIFAELDWSPSNINQSVDRCHRIGSKSAVTAYYFVVENSIDEQLVQTLIEKAKTFREVIG